MSRSVLHGSVVLFGAFGASAFSFLCQAIAARQLGPADYGQFVAIISGCGLWLAVGTLGLPWHLVRVSNSVGYAAFLLTRGWLPVALAIQLAFCGWVILSFGSLVSGSVVCKVVLLASVQVYFFALCCLEFFIAYWQFDKRVKALSGVPGLIQMCRAALYAAPILAGGASLEYFILAGGVSGAVALSLCCFSTKPSLATLKAGQAALLRVHLGRRGHLYEDLKGGFPYACMNLFHGVYGVGAPFVVSALLGFGPAASYSVAAIVLTVAFMAPSILYGRILLPHVLKWSEFDIERFKAFFCVNLLLSVAGGSLMGAVLAAGSSLIVPAVFGESYVDSAKLLMLLALCVPLRFASSAVGTALFQSELMWAKVRAHMLAAVVFFVAAGVLAKEYSVFGVAVAAVMSEAVLLGAQMYSVKKLFPELAFSASFRAAHVKRALRKLSALS